MKLTLIDDWRRGHKFSSAWLSAIGLVLGGTGALLSGIGDIAPWLRPFADWLRAMPRWQIWAGGALVCGLILIARFTLFRKSDPWVLKYGNTGPLSSRRVPYE